MESDGEGTGPTIHPPTASNGGNAGRQIVGPMCERTGMFHRKDVVMNIGPIIRILEVPASVPAEIETQLPTPVEPQPVAG